MFTVDWMTQLQVDVVPNKMIILGRENLDDSGTQYVNLSDYNARQLGVSRYHACIHIRSSELFIRDTRSSNGTFLNEQELYTMRDYPLKDGDVIKLSNLTLQVKFIDWLHRELLPVC